MKKVISETEDFKTFVFEDGHYIKYESGQFLTLVHHTGTSEIRRSYSITSSPALNEPTYDWGKTYCKRIDVKNIKRYCVCR